VPQLAWARLLSRGGRSSTAGLALLYVFVLVVFSVLSPSFRTLDNAENLLVGFAYIGILAIGMSLPLIVAGIDLSVGSIVGFVGMTVFDLSILARLPGPVVLVIALVLGSALGALNGLLIAKFALSPFIVTLAAMAAWRGATYAISGRQLNPELTVRPITDPFLVAVDASYRSAYGTSAAAVPSTLVYLVVAGLILSWLLARTRLGRNLYSVGGNERAAFLAGINVSGAKIVAYTLSGLSAAVVALILTSRLGTSPEDLGSGLELSAIAAAVVGGVSLTGGVGGVLGPIIGAFLIGTVYIGMQLQGVTTYAQPIVAGIILIGAVAYDRVRQARAKREVARSREVARLVDEDRHQPVGVPS
jgi:ribose/xylose/arabinose/galactoside ABC-type transport system permease subunit